MDWGHGYFTQTGYSYGYYHETMPARLRWAALVQGHDAKASHFRYLDAGCGQGVNLVLAALSHPESEFVGIDFMPRHIAHGRQLAERMGLTNVTFIEGDFTELADDHAFLGEFDYVICHGIATWISEVIRADLVRFVGGVLKPGGLFYNSYNTMPGWLPTVPLQHLVLLEQERGGPEKGFEAARAKITSLVASAPALAKNQPGIKGRLDALDGQDPAYLFQEYNNLHWRPLFVSEMIDMMAAAKLDYLGTATLAEVHSAAVPTDLRAMVEQESSIKIREQLRDLSINQGFRRDLYVKGQLGFFSTKQDRVIREQRFAANPFAARMAEGEPYKLRAGGVELHGSPAFYNQLLDRMAHAPTGCTIGELIESLGDASLKAAVVETMCMLVHGGWALPQLAAPDLDRTRALRGLASAIAEGAPYRYLPLPRSGCALQLPETDWLILDLMLEGVSRDELPNGLVGSLQRINRVLLKNGEAIQSAQDLAEVARSTVDDFFAKRWPFLQEQGVG